MNLLGNEILVRLVIEEAQEFQPPKSFTRIHEKFLESVAEMEELRVDISLIMDKDMDGNDVGRDRLFEDAGQHAMAANRISMDLADEVEGYMP